MKVDVELHLVTGQVVKYLKQDKEVLNKLDQALTHNEAFMYHNRIFAVGSVVYIEWKTSV